MVHSDSIVNNTKKARRDKNAQFPFDLIYKISQAKSTPAVGLSIPFLRTRPMETTWANHLKKLRRPGGI